MVAKRVFSAFLFVLIGMLPIFAIVVSVPVSFLWANYQHLGVSLSDLADILKLAVYGIPLACFLGFLAHRYSGFKDLLFASAGTTLLVTLVFPNSIGVLDGISDIEKMSATENILRDSLKLVVVFALALWAQVRWKQNHEFLVGLLMVASLGQLLYLAYTLKKLDEESVQLFDATLSQDRNIIIISFDSLQSTIFEKTILDRPDLAEDFSGFTFFPNTLGVAPNTARSTFLTMLGKIPALESSSAELFSANMANLLPAILSKEKGYDASTYGFGPCPKPEAWRCYKYGSIFDRYGRGEEAVVAPLIRIYYYSMMRVFPAFFVNRVHSYVAGRMTNPIQAGQLQTAQNDIETHGYGLSYFELKQYLSNIEAINKSPTFIYQHYVFSHQPFTFDRQCNYRASASVKQNMESAIEGAECAFSLMSELIRKLKHLGIYDNSVVVFLSDHGHEANINHTPIDYVDFVYTGSTVNFHGMSSISRYAPLLMYKDFYAEGPLEINSNEVSLLDVYASICKSSGLMDVCAGLNLDGFPLSDDNRDPGRKFILYEGGIENKETYFDSLEYFRAVEFSGSSRSGLQDFFLSTHPRHYYFEPADLRHQVGVVSGRSIRAKPDDSKEGFLSYGPYLDLKRGEYQFSIEYSSSESRGESVGRWEITSDNARYELFGEPLHGSAGTRKTLTKTIAFEKDTDDVEIRVFFDASGELSLYGVQIERLGN